MRYLILISAFTVFIVEYSNAQSYQWNNVSESHLPEIVLQKRNTMDAKVADIDHDGDPDIILAIEFFKNIILLNDGKGHFSDGSHLLPDKKELKNPKPYKYYPYHDSEDVAVEDFNHDGRLDIIVVTEDDKTNEWYQQKKNGTFEDLSAEFPVSGVTNGLIAGDFDNDGWVDLVLGNNGQNNYLRNAKGKWIDETAHRFVLHQDVTQDIEANDYDQDGDLDLLVGNEDDNRLLQNDGNGHFTDVTDQLFEGGISEETREADFGDVNGDGKLDIYFANLKMFTQKEPTQRLLIFEGGKYVDRSNQLNLAVVKGLLDADLVDVDGDQDLDLLTVGLDGFHIALNDGRGNFIDKSSDLFAPVQMMVGVDIEVHDFNMDGVPDIFLGNFRSADVLLFGKK